MGPWVVAALDFASLYRFESNIDEVWQTAYRTEVPRKESVAKTSDFDLGCFAGQKPGLHRLYRFRHALKLSGLARQKKTMECII